MSDDKITRLFEQTVIEICNTNAKCIIESELLKKLIGIFYNKDFDTNKNSFSYTTAKNNLNIIEIIVYTFEYYKFLGFRDIYSFVGANNPDIVSSYSIPLYALYNNIMKKILSGE